MFIFVLFIYVLVVEGKGGRGGGLKGRYVGKKINVLCKCVYIYFSSLGEKKKIDNNLKTVSQQLSIIATFFCDDPLAYNKQ